MLLYLINLDRAADRLGEFMAANAHLAEVVRFSAIDGAALDTSALIRTGVIKPEILECYMPARLGGALSHLALWNEAIKTGEALTICEDDALLHGDFESHAARLLSELPADWDLMLWGWNFNAALDIDFLPGVSPCLVLCEQASLRAGAANFQHLPLSPRPFRVRQALGLPCYSVSPKGARALRDFCLPLRPMQLRLPGNNRHLCNVGIDCMMAARYPDLQAFVSFPPLAVTKNQPEHNAAAQSAS
jgi:glycosyl transferase, family 25